MGMVKDYFNQPVTLASFAPGAAARPATPRATTLPCTACGHMVARGARRCPQCNEKRPAATVENLVGTVVALAVVIVVLIALFGGFSSGSSSHSGGGPAGYVRFQYGACLSTIGVSVDGAIVSTSPVTGWHAVILSDGSEFGVEDSSGTVEAGNDRAFSDLAAGGC